VANKVKPESLSKILKSLERDEGPFLEISDPIHIMLPTLYIPFERKGQASEVIKSFNEVVTKFSVFSQAFLNLPTPNLRRMQDKSDLIFSVPDIDDNPSYNEPRHEHKSYENLIFALADDLNIERRRIIAEKTKLWGESKHRGELVLAKEVALQVAKLYVKLRQENPTYGTGESKEKPQGPSTLFTRVVMQVFAELGLTADAQTPCKEAVIMIKSETESKG